MAHSAFNVLALLVGLHEGRPAECEERFPQSPNIPLDRLDRLG